MHREGAILSCVGGRFTEKRLLQLGLDDDVSLVVTREPGGGGVGVGGHS